MNKINFLISRFVSFFGNTILLAVVSLYFIDQEFGYVKLGLLFTLILCARVIVSPIAGNYLKNISPKITMILSDFISSVICLTLSVLLNEKSFIFIVILFVLLEIMNVVFSISSNLYVSNKFPNDLLELNSKKEFLDQLSMFLAPIIGIFVYDSFGFKIILIINGISFLISALMETILEKIQLSTSDYEFGLIKNLLHAINFIYKNKKLRAIIMIFLVYNIAISPIDELFLPGLFSSEIDININYMSMGLSICILGGGVGSIFNTRLKETNIKHYTFILTSILLFLSLLPIYLIFFKYNLIVFMLIYNSSMFYLGIAGVIVGIRFITFLQKEIEISKQSLVFGVLGSIMLLPLPFSTFVAGFISEVIGVKVAMIIYTVLGSVVIIIIYKFLQKNLYN
ncbi:MAG: MFS transporter [Bacilli bacterium]